MLLANVADVGAMVSMLIDLAVPTVALPKASVLVTTTCLAPWPMVSICALVSDRLQVPAASTLAAKVLDDAPTRTDTVLPGSVLPLRVTLALASLRLMTSLPAIVAMVACVGAVESRAKTGPVRTTVLPATSVTLSVTEILPLAKPAKLVVAVPLALTATVLLAPVGSVKTKEAVASASKPTTV